MNYIILFHAWKESCDFFSQHDVMSEFVLSERLDKNIGTNSLLTGTTLDYLLGKKKKLRR